MMGLLGGEMYFAGGYAMDMNSSGHAAIIGQWLRAATLQTAQSVFSPNIRGYFIAAGAGDSYDFAHVARSNQRRMRGRR